MLEEGVASADDIDAAMVLGYKFPVGPLRLTDLVGLDVRLGIAEQDGMAVQLTKLVMRATRAEHPLVDEQAQAVLFESPEKRRRMTEFLERRKR